MHDFAQTQLEGDERALFAMLLAPALVEADSDDVHGFALTTWSPQPLPEPLADALRASGLRVVEDPT
ncbi:hypothetical protein GCM10027569_34540 [Flindersiella endophytica]